MKNTYLGFLRKYVFVHHKFFWLVCLLTILQSMVSIGIPLITQNLIDYAIPERNRNQFIQLLTMMLLSYFLFLILNIGKNYFLAQIAERVAFQLRTELCQKISVMDYRYFDSHGISDILSKYNREVDAIKNNCGYMLIKIVSNTLTLIMASVMIIRVEWRILLVSVTVIILFIISNRYFGSKVKSIAEKSMECNEKSIHSVSEIFNNVLVTKLYSAYRFVNDKFVSTYQKQFRTQIDLELAYAININLGGLCIYLLTGLVWFMGGLSVFSGTMTVGVVLSLINYNNMLMGPLSFFCEFNNSYQGTVIAIKRLSEMLLDQEEEESGIRVKNPTVNRMILSDVSFGYDSSSVVLSHINAELCKGKITAFIGGSGSGKSTLVKLLLKLYQPTQGEIYLDQHSIREMNIVSLREKIAFVPQESRFYQGTILENIYLGKEVKEADRIKMIEYSKLLDLYDEIENLQAGWETELKSGTGNLSGGQKKRLDVLRALLKDCQILIFDESSASLDIQRRKKMFRLLNQVKEDKIIIFITHNLEECENFDAIYALKNKGIQLLSHNELSEAYSAS